MSVNLGASVPLLLKVALGGWVPILAALHYISMLKPTNNQTNYPRFLLLKPGKFVNSPAMEDLPQLHFN